MAQSRTAECLNIAVSDFDVEGFEIRVLQGIDFDYADIRAFSIENPSSQPDNFKLARDFMSEHGYQMLGSFGVNDIFAKG